MEWYKNLCLWNLVLTAIILLIILGAFLWLYSQYLSIMRRVRLVEQGAKNLLTEGRRIAGGAERGITDIVNTVKSKINNIDKEKLNKLTDSLNNLVNGVGAKVNNIDTSRIADRTSAILDKIQNKVNTLDVNRLMDYVSKLINKFEI